MSARNLLAKSKLPEFRLWLEQQGYVLLPVQGAYEVLRWKNKPRKAMPIIFDRQNAIEHFTCNKAAIPFVNRWLKERAA